MTTFLYKTFVKDYDNVKNPDVRTAYGMLSGVVGIILNLCLFALKLAVGLISGSVSIIADAVNNLSDGASSLITIIGFKLSALEPDEEHPFGHGRTEYLAGLFIAVIILFVGGQFALSSIDKILNPTAITFSPVLLIILCATIACKLWLGMFNKVLGKKINSSVLLATMQDSINDCMATAAVIISMLISYYFNINIDGYMGIAVSIFIIIAGVNIIKDTVNPLIGMNADPDVEKTIRDTLMDFSSQILDVHDLIVHNYGAGRSLASVHVEVPDTSNIVEIHEIVDTAEKILLKKTGIYVVIHTDPVTTNDARVDGFKTLLTSVLEKIDDRFKFHDFRVVDGTYKVNLIFDLVVPFDCNDKNSIGKEVEKALQNENSNINAIITVEHKM